MIKGKALIIIEKLDSIHVPFDVVVYEQSSSSPNMTPCEDWDLLSTNTLPVPSVARKLQVGEKIWVSVVYDFSYHQDYWGEWDVNLIYYKERVLKRRRIPYAN
jgi:hypothetical protein